MSNKLILRSRKPEYEIPLQPFGETVWKSLQKLNLDATCIIDARSGTKLTVKELISQANSIAISLLKRGITKSDRFCCFSANTIPYAVLQFAAYFLGVTIVPLSPTFNVYELKNEIKNSGSTVIFTSLKNAHNFEDIVNDNNNNVKNSQIKLIIVFDGNYSNHLSFNELLKEGKDETLQKIPYFNVDPENDIFILIYSSGSTGLPKCAMISHYLVQGIYIDVINSNQIREPIVSGHFPFGHISGSMSLPLWISIGSTYVIYGEYDEDLILQSVEKYKINVLPVFPAFGRKLIEGELADKYDLSSVRIIMTGGAAFPGNVAKAIIDKYNVIFKECYGMTEYMPITDVQDMDPIEFIPGNVGHVSPNTQLKIIDLNTSQSLGPNIDGEICVRGPKMFSGYLNNIKATNDTIDSEGWLHTGDIGHYDQNERLFITDRLKEVLKVGVVTISPTEIEQFLLTHESVAEVAVVGVKHETETQWPRAYVKVKEGKSVTEEELKKYVSETMAYTKQLKAGVIFVDEIPRTSIGKVDRQYFKKLIINEIIVKS